MATDQDVEQELAAERARLEEARSCLRDMYENAKSLNPQAGSADATRALEALLARRIDSFLSDPDTPLFFGRLDYDDPVGQRFHIGRRYVRDGQGDPVVLDWRAPVCTDFYQASAKDPRGVRRRRRFGFNGNVCTGFEDERIAVDTLEGLSDLVAAEIERPRTGAMRDIVATIQPDQDHVVRADLRTTVCVQGGPGTGKTAVGLHRAAYLLYTHTERLAGRKVLVIGPNDTFLDYIAAVLPALGELDVRHTTFEGMLDRGIATQQDEPETVRLKGDPRIAEVLARAVNQGGAQPTESLSVAARGRTVRLSPDELTKHLAAATEKQLPYEVTRRSVATSVGLALARRAGIDESLSSEKLPEQLARSKDVKAWLDTVLPPVDPPKLLERLLTDQAFRAGFAEGVFSDEEQAALHRTAATGRARKPRWSPADLVLLDEIHGLLERMPDLGHLVVDEAQDLSAMQCRAIGRRCNTTSATLLGDFAQATHEAALTGWHETLSHLGQPDGHVEILTISYRVPDAVLAWANRLVPHLGVEVAPVQAGRRSPGALKVEQCAATELMATVVRVATEALEKPGVVGVIVPDAMLAAVESAVGRAAERWAPQHATRVQVVPVRLVKGLEYDAVVVVEPDLIARAERFGLRRLYVALTRAVSHLTVVHAEPLPAALRDAGG